MGVWPWIWDRLLDGHCQGVEKVEALRRHRDRSPGKFDKGLKTVKKMNLEAEGKVAGLLILLLTWKIERAPNEPTH